MKIVEIAGDLRAHHRIELAGLDAREREGARFGDAHLAIAIDHQAQICINAAPHAQLNLVASAQHIVARHGDVLGGGEQAAIEQVVAVQGQALAGGLFGKKLKLGFLQRGQGRPNGCGLTVQVHAIRGDWA